MCVCMCVCVQSLSHVQLFAAPQTSTPGSSVHGILQVRILKWVVNSFSRGSSWLRDRNFISCISCIDKWILYHPCHLGSPVYIKHLPLNWPAWHSRSSLKGVKTWEPPVWVRRSTLPVLSSRRSVGRAGQPLPNPSLSENFFKVIPGKFQEHLFPCGQRPSGSQMQRHVPPLNLGRTDFAWGENQQAEK